MRRTFLRPLFAALLVGGTAAVLASQGLAGDAAKPLEPASDPLVVHEWGTFTSMQGADGIVLEGLTREEEPLPAFVYSRTKVRDCPLRAKGWKGLEVPANHVTQKMETPVLYFHTKSPRHIQVRVDFRKGLLTQWYPVTDLLGPPEGACDAGPLDLRKVESSFLQWDIDLLPRTGDAKPPVDVPAVAADDPWAFARNVDAAYVRTVPRKGPERAGPVEAERFLFYRGLGTFSLPIQVTTTADAVDVHDGTESPLAAAFVVAVDEGARHGTFVRLDAIAAGGTGHAALSRKDWGAWADAEPRLRTAVTAALVAEGMNDDEAKAMVATWSRSWFSTEGVRVLYVVPRPLVDALLPLHIDPAPSEIRRVLLGRVECITPDAEKEVEDALHTLALADTSAKDDARVPMARARLDRAGRFLEPYLRRVLATATDDLVRREAQARLDALAKADADALR